MEGEALMAGGQTYRIRKVLNCRQRILLIHEEEKERYSDLLINGEEGQKEEAAKFLARNGLSGIQRGGSGTWIPGEWSDFGFWFRRIRELQEGLIFSEMSLSTVQETENRAAAAAALCWAAAGIFFFLRSQVFLRREQP